MAKSALDKDLKKVVRLETATHDMARSLAAPGLAIIFMLAALIWAIRWSFSRRALARPT